MMDIVYSSLNPESDSIRLKCRKCNLFYIHDHDNQKFICSGGYALSIREEDIDIPRRI
jgi:hypothetical protein